MGARLVDAGGTWSILDPAFAAFSGILTGLTVFNLMEDMGVVLIPILPGSQRICLAKRFASS